MSKKYLIFTIKKTHNYFWSILICFSFAFPTSIYPPKGQLRIISVSDIQRYSNPEQNDFSESWSYSVLLDSSNTQIQLNFSIGGIGVIKKPVIGTSLYVSNLKNKNYSVAREYPSTKYSFNPQNHHLLFHPKIWIKGTLPQQHELYFETTKKDIYYLVKLNFSQIDTGYIWGNGIYKKRKAKETYLKMSFPIPYSRVNGIIVINQDTTIINGVASMSHVYQKTGSLKKIDFIYSYNTIQPKEIGLWIKENGSKKLIGYGLTKKGNAYSLLNSQNLKILSSQVLNKIQIPNNIQINAITFNQLSLPISSFSVLSEFSSFKKYTIKKIIGGEMLNFYGLGFSSKNPLFYRFSKKIK